MKLKIILTILSMLTIFSSQVTAADFVLITNKANATASISKQDAKKIFLGKKTTWEDGSKIEILILPDSTAHKPFIKTVVGKSPSQFEMFWKKAVFTGTGIPPLELKDASALKDAVSAKPGTISYLPPEQLDATVKKLDIR